VVTVTEIYTFPSLTFSDTKISDSNVKALWYVRNYQLIKISIFFVPKEKLHCRRCTGILADISELIDGNMSC
jgi:hypothetical protein